MQNKIVLVQFPFDDFSKSKVRPALCLTNSMGKFKHIIVAFISSKIEDNIDSTEIIFSSTEKQFSQTGLKVNSVLKLHKLLSIPQEIIISELGNIDSKKAKQVSKVLKEMFKFKRD